MNRTLGFLVLSKRSIRKIVFWALAVVASAAPLYGAKHPVPLDKNIKEDKCLECHADRTQGKVVHAAVQMGCFTCHVVRGSGDNTRVVVKTPKSTILCSSCHEDKKVTDPNKHVHAPVAVDCLRCHDPHTSENKALLKKATSGNKDANLCLSCHTQGLKVPEKGSRHLALDMGCDTCHVTHKTGEVGNPELEFHLTKAAPALCLDCHDAKDKKLVDAHSGQPFATADCTTCHDPHDSKAPKLMQAYLHVPFAEKMCESCHEPAQDGKVKLTQASVRELCMTCHDEVGKKIDNAKFPHAGALGDCTQCHSPHGGRFPQFVRPNPVTLCERCHDDQAKAHKTSAVAHNPVSGQCSICHSPHGGENEKLLRANGNNLCLACHGPEAKGAKVANSDKVSIFAGSVVLPPKYLDRTPHLPLSSGKGHPVPFHPVSGLDPSDPKGQKTITCLRCHTPHFGDRKLLVTGGLATGPLCAQCHSKMK